MTGLTPNDQVIYRFLLDRLPASERESFEERLFREPEFFELVEATEEELILRYVRAELDEPWRSWFEPVYFSNEVRRARVEEARSLVEISRARRTAPRPRHAAQAAIAGGLIAASAVGVGIFRSQSQPEPSQSVLALDPEVLRGESGGHVLRVRKGTKSVRLDLKIPASAAGGKYEAILGTPEAPGLWSGVVETGAAAVRTPVEIPVSNLGAGDYILELRDGGQTVASYQFRMQQASK